MPKGLVAKAEITINAPVTNVWKALTNLSTLKQLMFGADVITNWEEGSPIVWKGIWQGKPFEDKGTVIKVEKEKELTVTHYSPLSGTADIPENYHTVSYTLTSEGNTTHVTLTQDNNANEDEQKHSEWNWNNILRNLKKIIEQL